MRRDPEIIEFRKAIWAHVPKRDHYPYAVHTHGHNQVNFIAHGYVAYKHHAGHETATEWAASYELVEDKDTKGEIRMKKYHIIVVS